jgi:hypothetical protein
MVFSEENQYDSETVASLSSSGWADAIGDGIC